MKKLLAMLLTLAMVFALVACGGGNNANNGAGNGGGNGGAGEGGDSAETMKITVSIASFDNTFASFVMSRMKIFNEEHPELNIDYVDAANDAATQITQIEQAVINGTQAVICLAVDATQVQPIVTACNDANVPLIAFNRVFEGCDTFVGADNATAGRLVAERCAELLGGSGSVALVQGVMGQANTYERTNAIVETFEQNYPDIQIVLDGAADWKRDKGLELVETWLQSGTEFDAVIALNDDSALGAQQALAAVGKENDIPVLSINGDPSGINGVNDGLLDCTAFQAPFTQADTALEIAMEYINGGTPTDSFKVEYELITKDNVADYMQFTSVE